MTRKLTLIVFVLMMSLLLAVPAFAAGPSHPNLHPNADAQIYVTGQGLVYDSIVISNELPPHGPFQKLEPGGPTGLQTEFGPGDQGYVGGRWWLDKNGNNQMDEGELFSCPLLGPGYELE